MRYELFIDGQMVDLVSEDLILNYKSNVLSEIKKVTSNNSYTIKLQKTQRNLSVISHADLVSSGTQFPYLTHRGTLFRDGIEIIRNASVVLLSASDDIEIALIWNDTEAFNNLIQEEGSLRDLPSGSTEGVDYITWATNPANSAMFPNINWGLKEGELYAAPHPCVSVRYVLDKIEQKHGVTFNFPSDREGFINNMVLPLVSRHSDPSLEMKELRFYQEYSGAGYRDIDVIDYEPTGTIDEAYGEMSEIENKYGFVANDDFKNAIIRVLFTFTDTTDTSYANTHLIIETYNRETATTKTLYDELVNVSGTTISKDVTIVGDIETDDIVVVRLYPVTTGASVTGDIAVNISLPLAGEIQLGNIFPFVKNLPDIKESEFIQAIASICGMYAYPDAQGNITFAGFDKLYRSKSIAYDWSDKMIAKEDGTPQFISYTIDEMSQRNWFRYEEDDADAYNSDAFIEVNDRTLPYEGDIVVLPFAASKANKIPSYSYNAEGELVYDEVKPRIMLLYSYNTEGVTTYQANFDYMEWDNLLERYYTDYRGLVNNVKIIKEYVKLSGVDLKNINFSTPVYLRQYGAYFAILTIKTKEDEISEVELIKL